MRLTDLIAISWFADLLSLNKEKVVITMFLDMLLKIKFNRAVDIDNDYISAGGFEMIMDGKTIDFDFAEQSICPDTDNSSIVTIELRKPLYSQYKEFNNITISDLENITKINECYVFTGEEGETELAVLCIEDISFFIVEPEGTTISVKENVINAFNNKLHK